MALQSKVEKAIYDNHDHDMYTMYNICLIKVILSYFQYFVAGTLVPCQGKTLPICYCRKEKEEYFWSEIALPSREITCCASGN